MFVGHPLDTIKVRQRRAPGSGGGGEAAGAGRCGAAGEDYTSRRAPRGELEGATSSRRAPRGAGLNVRAVRRPLPARRCRVATAGGSP